MAENSLYAEVSVWLFKIIFSCPTSWFILKQLDNLPSLSKGDSFSVSPRWLHLPMDNSGSLCTIVKYDIKKFLRRGLRSIICSTFRILKWYYDEKIVYPILILSASIFEKGQNGTLGFSIPHRSRDIEVFEMCKWKRMTSFTHRD